MYTYIVWNVIYNNDKQMFEYALGHRTCSASSSERRASLMAITPCLLCEQAWANGLESRASFPWPSRACTKNWNMIEHPEHVRAPEHVNTIYCISVYTHMYVYIHICINIIIIYLHKNKMYTYIVCNTIYNNDKQMFEDALGWSNMFRVFKRKKSVTYGHHPMLIVRTNMG